MKKFTTGNTIADWILLTGAIFVFFLILNAIATRIF